MPSVGFEPALPVLEGSHIFALNCRATGIDRGYLHDYIRRHVHLAIRLAGVTMQLSILQ